MFLFLPAQTVVGNLLGTFKEFPPRQKPGSFSVGDALEKIQAAHSSAGR
jgi:arylsulfatase